MALHTASSIAAAIGTEPAGYASAAAAGGSAVATPLVQAWLFNLVGVPTNLLTTTAYSLLIIATVFAGSVSLIAMFCIWWERKVAGRIQARFGPNRVGPIGLLQSLADGVKLVFKEDLIPRDADAALFRLAPYVTFAPVFAAFLALPFGPDMTFEPRLSVGVFWILAIMSVEVIGIILAGWASNNKWSVYGAMREACQMVSYEIPLGIAIIVAVMAAGTLDLVRLGHLQAGGIHTWLVFKNPFTLAAFFVFFVASLASNKRAPFDLPESDSELVAGFHTEYSGLRFSFFFFAEYAAMFAVGGIQTALFLGGWNDPFGLVGYSHARLAAEGNTLGLILLNLIAVGIFVSKVMLIIYVQMWVRWTLPRPRIDQVLYACVKVLLPLSFVLLLGAALWQLLVPDLAIRPPADAAATLLNPWLSLNPWDFAEWKRLGGLPTLVTSLVLALVGVVGFSSVCGWVAYAIVTGRGHKQRLTEPGVAPVIA